MLRWCLLQFVLSIPSFMLSAGVVSAATANSDRVAIVVGINDYLEDLPDLSGAENDAQAMQRVLVERWGFAKEHVKLLLGRDASRARILEDLAALTETTGPGTLVVFYFAGHGVSASGGLYSGSLPQGTGALLPADFSPTTGVQADLIVGRTDLRPILALLDSQERQILVIVDSCFSGNTVRGRLDPSPASPRLPVRNAQLPAYFWTDVRRGGDPVYPYRNVVYLSAAAEYEPASDIPEKYLDRYPTLDGKPHGAFTDALLRGLSGELPGLSLQADRALDFQQLREALAAFMKGRRYAHSPQLLPPLGATPQVRMVPMVAGASERPFAKPTGVSLRTPDDLRLRQVCEREARCEPDKWDFAFQVQGDDAVWRNASGDLIGTSRADLAAVSDRIAHLKMLQEFASRVVSLQSNALQIGFVDPLLGQTRREHEQFALRFKFKQAARLVVLVASVDGALNVLYPAFEQELAALPAGSQHELAGITVGPPFGQDTILAFAMRPEDKFASAWTNASFGPSRGDQARIREWIERQSSSALGIAELTLTTAP